MFSKFFRCLLGALTLSVLPAQIPLVSSAHGASYDPNLTWRSIHTEHFVIHFHGGEEQLAEEMSLIVEQVYTEMTAELDWIPKFPTEIVLLDNTDSANGYATYLPRNTIVIFVTAPEGSNTLSFYEDWNDAIFTHEFTHILHIDTVAGLPALLRKIFGRVVVINGLAPNWIVEGQATMQETWQSNTGRGRGTIPDMIKRTATLENQFPPLGNMDGFQSSNPGGNIRYLFGQDFMNFIAEQTDDQVWTRWNHNYGKGIPYWLPSRKTFGKTLPVFYEEWKASVEQRYTEQKAQIEAIGITPYTLLTTTDRNCAFGHYSPDGSKIVYSCFSLETGGAVYLSDPEGKEEHLEIPGVFGRNFAWRTDSTAFAYSAMRTVNRFNLYSDIYLHPVSASTQMLTTGKRVRDPEFSLDGTHLLIVGNEVQNNQLNQLTIDQKFTQLTDHTDHTQYSTPKYSPDGKWIAVSMWKQGKRDLWLLNAQAEPIRQLTNDMALDTEPRWSPDGKTLYFSSDRTGVYNIFAIDLQTEKLYQVTNVLSGAFTPSIDNTEENLLFTIYHSLGYALARMPINKTQWIEAGRIYLATEDALHTSNIIPTSPTTIEQKAPWKAPTPTYQWWEWYQKRQYEQKQAQNTAPFTQDTLHYAGLTGLGTAVEPWLHHTAPDSQKYIGYIGLPHEQQYWGEWNGEIKDSPSGGADIQTDTMTDKETKEEEAFNFTYPVERYNPAHTLFPTFIAPGLYRTLYGFMGNLAVSSTDTLRQHFYSATVSYRSDSQFIGWSVGYLWNKYIPLVSMGAYTYTVPYSNIYHYAGPPENGGTWIPSVEKAEDRYWDKRLAAYAQVSYAKNSRQSYFARWEMTHRTPWIASGDGYSNAGLPSDAYRPYLPTRGVLSGIGGGWRYVKGMSYVHSISPENTRLISLVGQLQTPWLGSYTLDDTDAKLPFTRVQLTGEWREYKTMPWGNNHVLATKIAAGLSSGDTQRYGSFRLGGSFGESGYYTLPDELRALRGFDPATISGDGYYLASVEYRLPLHWFDWGYNTYPFFLRNVSGALFMDTGYAFDDVTAINSTPLTGMGAEFRSSFIVSWGLPISVRGGYAFGLNGGTPLGSPQGFYGWVGSSF